MPDTITLNLHVIRITQTSIETATTSSTEWRMHLPKNHRVEWDEPPIEGKLCRATVEVWLPERHQKVITGTWGSSEWYVCHA
jgi:hypothetical protein